MRQETKYNELIGIKDGCLVYLNTTFRYSDNFQGATGFELEPVTQDQLDYYNSEEYTKEFIESCGIWQESVASGNTEKSLAEFSEDFLLELQTNTDCEYIGHDTSYIYDIDEDEAKKYFPNAVTFNCIGCGRIFNRVNNFDILVNAELLKEIEKFESKEETNKDVKTCK